MIDTSYLTGLPLFAGLSPEQLRRLTHLFRCVPLEAGQTVFHQSDPAQDFFVLLSGEIVIRFEPYDGGSLDVERITAGGLFGWSAALGQPCYTSSAICVQPGEVLAASGRDWRQLMRQDRELGVTLLERMAQVVAHRVSNFQEQLVALLSLPAWP